jgi:phosphoribosylformylglycinamidine synthase
VKVRVYVTLKADVLDPQGKAVEAALRRLGYSEVRSARVGRCVDLVLEETDRGKAEQRVREMCERLLSNPVIEDAHHEFAD